ncbi:MAG TPA: DNA-formamidopyrimidine glycosylase family protein [Chloroflexia bacterium]|nr:DNA-formamidopyrimidine glycosylase family protein [Chloroflexia bacterium]
MPEGPNIKNTADRLRKALQGQTITTARSRYKKAKLENWPEKIEGQTVLEVRSHGKNLFIELSNGYTIYSHMLMWGSWHLYQPGQEWAKEERLARLVLETPQVVAVLFNAPVCELLASHQMPEHKTANLGPDLLAPNFDAAEVWRRLQLPENRQREVGDAIMDQNILAGIGNILKSEILFQAGLHPQRPIANLTTAEYERLIAYSLMLLRRSYELGGFKEAFLPPELRPAEIHGNSLGYVYRRRNKPCYVCRTPIEMVRQGLGERSTWFCPTCQPLHGESYGLEERLKHQIPHAV